MAEIDLTASFFTGTLELNGNGYTAHASKAELAPTANNEVHTDISGTDHPLGGLSSWVLNIDLAQDWETAQSLSLFLFANDGQTAPAELHVAGGTFAFDVLCSASAAGGQGKTAAKASVSLPATYPVFTPDA